MTDNPTGYLPKNHPIRSLLESAAYHGTMPTKAQLDKLDAYDLPDGKPLSRFRADLNIAARDCVEIKATGANKAAMDTAGAYASALAERMTPDERALSTADEPGAEPLDVIANRIFNNH